MDNPAVQEALLLWKTVAGPPEWDEGSTGGQVRGPTSAMALWIEGRYAMTLEWYWLMSITSLQTISPSERRSTQARSAYGGVGGTRTKL